MPLDRLVLIAAGLALTLGSRADAQSHLMKQPEEAPRPTTGCHCFRDRTFDAERPSAADPYILATSRSTLLSAALGPSKSSLVQAVMTGTAPEDLWVAHWVGARSERSAEALLEARRAKGSWRAALADVDRLPPPFARAVASGAPDTDLAALAVDDVLVTRVGAPAAALRALRAAGASSSETIAATVLAPRLAMPAPAILARVRDGGATWGTLLEGARIAPGDLDDVIRALVR
jgi:hypothetical protein